MADIVKKILIRKAPGAGKSRGFLIIGNRTWPCILGKNGITTRKREGDGKTPAGDYPLLFGFFRRDRVNRFPARLAFTPIAAKHGWCDDPVSSKYNRMVSSSFDKSHEKLMRADGLYDVVIVLDHNYTRRIRNRGSAIFFHLDDGKSCTAGCIGVSMDVMKHLVSRLDPQTRMIIFPG